MNLSLIPHFRRVVGPYLFFCKRWFHSKGVTDDLFFLIFKYVFSFNSDFGRSVRHWVGRNADFMQGKSGADIYAAVSKFNECAFESVLVSNLYFAVTIKAPNLKGNPPLKYLLHPSTTGFDIKTLIMAAYGQHFNSQSIKLQGTRLHGEPVIEYGGGKQSMVELQNEQTLSAVGLCDASYGNSIRILVIAAPVEHLLENEMYDELADLMHHDVVVQGKVFDIISHLSDHDLRLLPGCKLRMAIETYVD